MSAVALADEQIQKKVADGFVPLKLTIMPGDKEFPVAWQAMQQWGRIYQSMGGENCEGLTGCSVVSPDKTVEYANTGSAMVWEMFDSTAYDAKKFAAMLDRGTERHKNLAALRAKPDVDRSERELTMYLKKMSRDVEREGRFRLPPPGFTIEAAMELFEMSGDLQKERADDAKRKAREQQKKAAASD